jgi:hypothetical protein
MLARADRRPYHRVTMEPPLRVVLEIVRTRAFAVAVDWPGLTRGGRDEDAALDALMRAAPRYAAALAVTGVPFGPPGDRGGLAVVDRLAGTAGTEFGAPSVHLPGDDEPLAAEELDRQASILRAGWAALEAAAALYAGDELRKGPRGGGRDLPKIAEHVRGADEAYLVKLGSRPPKRPAGPAPLEELHAAALAALQARALGLPVPNASRAVSLWSPRWYVRYATWHWLDHAWEIEDRALRPGTPDRALPPGTPHESPPGT